MHICALLKVRLMRPKKKRWIKCQPGERCFRPECKPLNNLEGVVLTMDELEAIRLADLKGLKQVEVAKRMGIHRSTISRIIANAHKKIADALVNIKAVKMWQNLKHFFDSKFTVTFKVFRWKRKINQTHSRKTGYSPFNIHVSQTDKV